jgi:hypothetical protein
MSFSPREPRADTRLGAPRALAVFAAYLLLAGAATWPLAARARDHVFGLGTPPLNIWSIGVVLRQLVHDPLHLFDGNAFYPYGETLAFSEHLFVPSLLAAPVAWLTGNLVLAHNVAALLTIALAGLGMYLLALELTAAPWGAFVAGVFYAFHTWNVNELIRLQILSNQWFPFCALALVRYFGAPSNRRAALAALAWLLQCLSCMYWALYSPLMVGPLVAFLQWRSRLPVRAVGRLVLWFALAGAVQVPFLMPYVRTSARLGFSRQVSESVALDRYLNVLPGNPLYAARLGTAGANRDAAHFLGFSAMALAAAGLVAGRFRRDAAAWRSFLAASLLAALLLSLGPEIQVAGRLLGPGPYTILYEWVPGFRNVRNPERFAQFVVLSMGPLIAAGVGALRLRAAGPLLAIALFAEHFSAPLPLAALPSGSGVPAVYRWLARQDDVRVVAEVPSAHFWLDREDALPMYLSTFHWKRTAQGFTGYFPPIQNYVRWRLYHFPAPESLAFLERFGVDTVVIHPGETPSPVSLDELGQRGRLIPMEGGDCVLRLRTTGTLLAPPRADPPGLVELDRSGWRVRTSVGGAAAALDGDPSTVWTTVEGQRAGDFILVRLDRPVPVARISIGVGQPFQFPMHLRLTGRAAEGGDWQEIPLALDAAHEEMFRALLHRPRQASLDLAVGGRVLEAFRVEIAATDPFAMPWAVPEIRAYTVPGGR